MDSRTKHRMRRAGGRMPTDLGRRLAIGGAALAVLALTAADPGKARGPTRAPQPVRDSAIVAAQEALAEGWPWLATQRITPALRDSARRTPTAVLTAARAATGWSGWTEVRQLLQGASWLDSGFAGEGRALLARARLGLGDTLNALADARAAVSTATDSAARGERLAILAVALEGAGQRDSARAAYEAAARDLPAAADWLRLHAAMCIADSAERARAFAALTQPAARSRVPRADGFARERSGDTAGAIRAYRAAGARLDAFRLGIHVTGDTATRRATRRDLIAYLGGRPSAPDAKAAVAMLDSAFTPLTAAEELVVGHALTDPAMSGRAASAYARAVRGGLGDAADHVRYALLLAAIGRGRDAVTELARVTAPPENAAGAAYQRGRLLVSLGDLEAGRQVLRAVIRDYPSDTSAGTALYLLADLATDERRDLDARAALLEIGRRYPQHPRTPVARFRAAMIAFVSGSTRGAALEYDSLRARYPMSTEWLAATYWSGRAWLALGDSAAARDRWRAVIARDPQSYYSMLSASRLGESWPTFPAARDTIRVTPALDSAAARIALLEHIALDSEATVERDWIAARAANEPAPLLSAATFFVDARAPQRAISLAQRAITAGAPRDSALQRLLYPAPWVPLLSAEAATYHIDPALVAALIRQESLFDPLALSRANARGLMQLLPDVGARVAGVLKFPVWDAALLYQPDANVALGTYHLAQLLKQYDVPLALAAYNAGESRVDRWKTKACAREIETFIECIPYVETRDYVRIVMRNREMYRALYTW